MARYLYCTAIDTGKGFITHQDRNDFFITGHEGQLASGGIWAVSNTKFDLNEFYKISQTFLDKGGIDHNYILKNKDISSVAATIFSNFTGMGVEYFTNQPGMQFYTGNMMDKAMEGKNNKIYEKNFGLCLEPQNFPDAINNSNFPSPIIKSGEKYKSKIIMKLRNDFI